MKKIAHLIFNPVAGQGDAQQDLATIEQLLSAELDLTVHQTTKDTCAEELTERAIAAGAEVVIAAGGDGTVSAVAGKIVNTNIALGVIARGTANAFANALNIPIDIRNACQTILNGDSLAVDLALCNGYPMLLLVGIGLEANAVEAASREAKNRFGILAYLIAGVQQLRAMKPFEVKIETEETVITCQATAITVANAAPATSILAQGTDAVDYTDGLLDITIFAPENTMSALMASYHLLQSALLNHATTRDDIGYLRARSAKITTNPQQKVTIDGEIIDTQSLEVKSIPAGLKVLVAEIPVEEPSSRLTGLPNLIVQPKIDVENSLSDATAIHD